MKLLGDTSRTIVTMAGLKSIRIEAFQDDRFRLMFVVSSRGKDEKWIPVRFRKGTKIVDLDEVWENIEKQVKAVDPSPTEGRARDAD